MVRPTVENFYLEGGRWRYVIHPRWAEEPSAFTRAFALLQEDLLTLFEYVEPADQNRDTYSLRTYELLLRTCTEVETNFKAIFEANGYKRRRVDMKDYWKIGRSHFLYDYDVRVHDW